MYCCAFGCKSCNETGIKISFFRFPKDEKRRKLWSNALRRVNYTVTDNSRICEKHFISGMPHSSPDHPDYVPSVFSFSRVCENRSSIMRYERAQKRKELLPTSTTGRSLKRSKIQSKCSAAAGSAQALEEQQFDEVGLAHDYDAGQGFSLSEIEEQPAAFETVSYREQQSHDFYDYEPAYEEWLSHSGIHEQDAAGGAFESIEVNEERSDVTGTLHDYEAVQGFLSFSGIKEQAGGEFESIEVNEERSHVTGTLHDYEAVQGFPSLSGIQGEDLQLESLEMYEGAVEQGLITEAGIGLIGVFIDDESKVSLPEVQYGKEELSTDKTHCGTTPRKRPVSSETWSQITPKKFKSRYSQASTPRKSIQNARIQLLLKENRRLKNELSIAHQQIRELKNRTDRILCIENLVKRPKRLQYYTGIRNYEVYQVICRHVPSSSNIVALSFLDCVLLVLVKIRRNLGNEMLSHLFGISLKTVTKIMSEVTPALAKVLSAFIVNPSSANVKKNLPHAFKTDRFKRTRFIIDCTEIYIQRPKSLEPRAQTYSNYKGRNTVKILVACTPTGGVAFISKAFTGRVADKELARRCGFYDLVEEGDHILADRGFEIEVDINGLGATIDVPAFKRGKKQLSGREVELSAQISRARIHIERCIGRLKNFAIFGGTIPITLFPHLDNYLKIAGGLCNLMPPLVSTED